MNQIKVESLSYNTAALSMRKDIAELPGNVKSGCAIVKLMRWH